MKKDNTSRQDIFDKANALTPKPIAFEALWDGDTIGWHILFNAITADHCVHWLGMLSGGGDIRVFQGEVPPWPEALRANAIGQELALRFNVQFHFPSPNRPELSCPSWLERHKAFSCRQCSISLLRSSPEEFKDDLCDHCESLERQKQREAQWTPEQRSGPRCSVCSAPATTQFPPKASVLGYGPACATCTDKYTCHVCKRCDDVTISLEYMAPDQPCDQCALQEAIEGLSQSQLDIIYKTTNKRHQIGLVGEMLGIDFIQAIGVLERLIQTKPNDTT